MFLGKDGVGKHAKGPGILHASMFQVMLSELDSLQPNQEHRYLCCDLYHIFWRSDTDVFFILLFHAHDLETTLFVDIGTGKQQRLVNI